jgi:hypothetical protein
MTEAALCIASACIASGRYKHFWKSGDELADFKKLAQAFGSMTDSELASALSQGDLLELCDDE